MNKVAGMPLVPPPIEQVEAESHMLEEILDAKLYEIVIQESLRRNISPFHMLNNYVAEAALRHIMAKVQSTYKPKPKKPDTAAMLQDRLRRLDVTKGMQ
jgi:hypothetical protein